MKSYDELLTEHTHHVRVTSLSPKWRAERINIEMRLALAAPNPTNALAWAHALGKDLTVSEMRHIDQSLVHAVCELRDRLRAERKVAANG